jgi:dephospho-CoA kinase
MDPSKTASVAARVPVIGIVGGIGSGKSALSRWVAERYPVVLIDADQLGHLALADPVIISQLRTAFDDGILDAAGGIDRSALARRVFGAAPAQRIARQQLEAIVHPAIRQRAEALIAAAEPQQHAAVLLDAAILLEAGWRPLCDRVIYIDTPLAQRQAATAARGWTPEQLAEREASQWPLDKKRAAADIIIRNDGPLAEAGSQLWQAIEQTERLPLI